MIFLLGYHKRLKDRGYNFLKLGKNVSTKVEIADKKPLTKTLECNGFDFSSQAVDFQ